MKKISILSLKKFPKKIFHNGQKVMQDFSTGLAGVGIPVEKIQLVP